MSIQTNEITKLANQLKHKINVSYFKFNNIYDYFKCLRALNFNKLKLLIIDSAIKDMPMENLHKTLLLKQDEYVSLLQTISKEIETLYENNTLKPPIRHLVPANLLKTQKPNLAQRLRIKLYNWLIPKHMTL